MERMVVLPTFSVNFKSIPLLVKLKDVKKLYYSLKFPRSYFCVSARRKAVRKKLRDLLRSEIIHESDAKFFASKSRVKIGISTANEKVAWAANRSEGMIL